MKRSSSFLTRFIAPCLLVAVVLPSQTEARKKKEEAPVPLTEAGEKYLAEYTAKLDSLKAEILKAVPKINEAKLSAYQKAREAEVAAIAQLETSRKGNAEITEWKRHISDYHKKWIPISEDRLKKAKEALKKAKSPEEKASAEEAVAKAEKGVLKEQEGLALRHKRLAAALEKYPNVEEVLKQAEIALPKAEAASKAAVESLGLTGFLQSDKLDATLAACHLIAHASPRGLAVEVKEEPSRKKLIDNMLADGALLVEIAIADGAKDGKYGRAMEILQRIQTASSKAKSDPTLKKLALAMALEHATPVKLRNAVAETNAPEFVDPVKRYLAYEKAFLNRELDPCFDNLSVWDLRLVVNGEEPDHIAAWGRDMLANYRPDHILTNDERWRYVDLVRTDIRYGSQDNKFDQDELQFFQNILKNGGICGRRAFIGRFLLRAFGVPVTGRPQPGHAALAHYTSDGWVVCLGAGWGKGGTHTPYKKDLDFLATTQVRAMGDAYLPIARSQWIGSAYGEQRAYGFKSQREEIPFWNALALYTQRDLIEKSEAKTLASVGEDIGEANQTKEKVEIIKVVLSEKDREITTAPDGSVTIPAAATSNLKESTDKVIFMPSNQGGLQLHYSRMKDAQPLEYTFEVPKAGKYELVAKVVTPSWKQNLMITTNGGADTVKLELPHTVGMWDTTAPVILDLKAGENVLTFNHQTDGYDKGFSIHHFKLSSVR